jgi:hypothetical protein
VNVLPGPRVCVGDDHALNCHHVPYILLGYRRAMAVVKTVLYADLPHDEAERAIAALNRSVEPRTLTVAEWLDMTASLLRNEFAEGRLDAMAPNIEGLVRHYARELRSRG